MPELPPYGKIGSRGAGIDLFAAETVNFGASNTAIQEKAMALAAKVALLLSMTAGGIVLADSLLEIEAIYGWRRLQPHFAR